MSTTVTSTVKPHSGPSGFWSHAMSPLITWPPSSALRLLQIRNFVFWSCCDLAATNPTLHAWPKVTFQLSNIQQYFCSLGFAKGSKATWEKLLVHPAGSRPFDLLPKFWKLFFLKFYKGLGAHLCSVHYVQSNTLSGPFFHRKKRMQWWLHWLREAHSASNSNTSSECAWL